jgi:cytoskeletal protein RodZ
MSDTVGTKLKNARIGGGFSVSDVSHLTRITEAQILGLESDDYSVFPGVAYARSFLSIYSSHLGVDATAELEAMAKPGLVEFRGAQRLPKINTEPQETVIPIVKGVPDFQRRRPVKSILVPLIMLVMVLLLPAAFLIGKRIGEAQALAAKADSGTGENAQPDRLSTPSAEVLPKDPIRERKPSDGSLPGNSFHPPSPNPELDALISASPSKASARR